MKKVISILLLFIYSLSSFGATVKAFYCCGKLKSLSVMLGSTGRVDTKKDNNDCCKIKYKYLHEQDQHTSSSATFQLNNPFYTYSAFAYSNFLAINCSQAFSFHESHAPPIFEGIPVYLSNRVFRI